MVTDLLLTVFADREGAAEGDPTHNSTTQLSRYPPFQIVERFDGIRAPRIDNELEGRTQQCFITIINQ